MQAMDGVNGTMIKLSKRLQRVADYVTLHNRVADIGSDHAMLPCYLLQSGKCPSAISGELNHGPYRAAKKQAAAAGLVDRLDVRQGNGLSVLKAGEADTVTIAGMGGTLMSEILEAGNADGKLKGVKELVLQPNVGENRVRAWLLEKGWYLAGEAILEEDGKIYEVLHARLIEDAEIKNAALYDGSFLALPWEKAAVQDMVLQMGPHLLREASPILMNKWRCEIEKLERICKQMGSSELSESTARKKQFHMEIKRMEEVLQCLQTAQR